MRSSFAIAALTILLVPSGAFGIEKSQAQDERDYVRPFVAQPQADQPPVRRFSLGTQPSFAVRRHSVKTCYSLRTMLAAKQKDSDDAPIVGQRTCTPSSQFQVKTADQRP